MISDKKSVQLLYKFCLDLGVVDWIISPGSRNAPITLTLANDSRFNTMPVVDERSAAFIALGRSLKTGVPTGISCTSGSASLNYAPAISEAYYQGVPMLVVTADRPQKWIDNGEGQSIDQIDVYRNYCLRSFHLNEDDSESQMLNTFQELANCLFGVRKGPVHLNLAFDEPLYNKVKQVELPGFLMPEEKLFTWEEKRIIDNFLSRSRVMVLVGQMEQNEKLAYLLSEMQADKRLVVLTETNSNQSDFHFVNCIDRTLPPIALNEFHPELVITIGGAIVSKRIKKFLRNVPELEHWHISPSGTFPNTFEVLKERIEVPPEIFFRALLKNLRIDPVHNFQNLWIQRSMLNKERHDEFIKNVDWSDLKAHAIIYQWLPDNAVLHQGNSSVVRYYQLFDAVQCILYQSNRGVSGIDGILSTAIGFAYGDDRLNVVVIGDLSFQYDINALWNKLPKENLLIIVINNGGGSIFKIIDGPSTTGVLEKYFQVGSESNLEKLAQGFQINYSVVDSFDLLESKLEEYVMEFQKQDFKGGILEVKTSGIPSDEILSTYFNYVNPQ